MNERNQQDTIKAELQEELAKWQTKIDEARVQLHLGTKEVEAKMQPYVEELEKEMGEAKKQWEKLESASESSWEDIKQGLDLSVSAMKEAFASAKQHFSDDKKS